jgi:hypothetical protein
MAILNTLAKLAVKPLPRVISPESRAAVDYLVVGSFFASACGLWGRNKRAALAALICGAAELGINLLTDYRGRRTKEIGLAARTEIDLGLGAMTAAMPEFFGFKHDSAKSLFHAHGVAVTMISGLTRLPEAPRTSGRSTHQRTAA